MLDRKLATALALWAFVLVATDVAAQIQPNTWLFRDGRFYVNVNENLLMNGSLEDPFAASWYDGSLAWNYDLSADFSNVALGARGEHYHFRPWLLPILSTPLYFALGLFGVLLFNLLTYCVIAAGSYRFARAYAPADVSALTAVVMVFASGFRHHAYNYSVDLLLVALFCAGLAMLVERKGLLGGALIAAGVMIKPPTLLYAPALALILWERRDFLTLKRGVAGGSAVLAFYALVNTYMYGRPWWTGYNRAVITVHGEPAVFDDNTNFQTPFWEGARELFSGADGLVWWHGAFVLALPGLLVLARRRPRTALGVTASFAGAFYLFSKFQHHHDRFMFPAIALLAVPVALGLRALAGSLRRIPKVQGTPAAAFFLAIAAVGALFVTPGAMRDRVIDHGAVDGAMLLAEGSFDMHDATSDVEVILHETRSNVSLGRGERWVPRASPPVVLLLTPFAALGGRPLMVAFSILVAGLAVYAATRLLSQRVPAPLAAAIAAGALLAGPGRELAVGDPSSSLGALAILGALVLATTPGTAPRRWIAAGALSVLGGSMIGAPIAGLVVLAAVLFLGWRADPRDPRALRLSAAAGAVALGVHAILAYLFFGDVLATADTLVVVDAGGSLAAPGAVSALDGLAAITSGGPSTSRGLVPLLFFLFPGVLLARSLSLRVALAALVGTLAVPGALYAHEHVTLLATLALACTAGVTLMGIAERATPWAKSFGSWRALAAVVATALVVCLGLGLARRAAASERPFWIGTPSSVRAAEVHLGDVPCDFLAWENMAWECSYYDGGAMGRVGLALPDGPTLDGHVVRNMLLVPAGERSHEPRIVTWEHVPVGPRLMLVVATPDGFDADAELTVRADGEEIGRVVVRREPRSLVEHTIDTSSLEGEVELEIEMRPAGRLRRAAVLVAGGFLTTEARHAAETTEGDEP